jgi:hypothetical protein
VLFLVKNVALAERIQRVAAGHGGAAGRTPIRVVPWPGLPAAQRQAITDALGR